MDGWTDGRMDGWTDGRKLRRKDLKLRHSDAGFRLTRDKTWKMMPYERYEAWKAAHKLALEVYKITDQWPTHERYQLTAQIRRAALSVPTNIAEGAAKRGPREFRRYLDIARGSLSEVSYLLRFSKDRGILDSESFLIVHELRDRVGKLTWGLYASLKPTSVR
jgi:four helix bundle protein